MPGLFVEGWTDRPRVAPDLRHIWSSYAEWCEWDELTPAAAARWIEWKHWREDAEGRALLFNVFLALASDRIEIYRKPEPSDD